MHYRSHNEVPSLQSDESSSKTPAHGPAYALQGRQVKLGQFIFDIHVEAGLQDDSGAGLMGAHRHNTQQLWLDGNLRGSMVPAVLLHEILHEMYKQTGREQSEGVIDAVAYFLSQVLIENPWLARVLSTPERSVTEEQSHA